jgi:uncharacterized membrane protein
MIRAIMALAPHFSIYVISFLICTVAWISHHEFIHDLDYVDPRLLWLNSLYLMWIAFLPFPTGRLGNHPEQPVAVAVYGSVCAITCLSFSAMRWYASFRGRLMKKRLGGTKLRRDLRLSLYFCLYFTSRGWLPGCSPHSWVCSYTVLFRRLTPLADSSITKAAATRADRRPGR